jgi:F420-0:gamma-glutamyl ligase
LKTLLHSTERLGECLRERLDEELVTVILTDKQSNIPTN